jgi:transcriptional regulator with XRE-family HTH domain
LNRVIAYNLRKAREARNMTQEEAARAVADFLGRKPVSRATWAAAEHSSNEERVRQFTGDELLAYSLVFNVPLIWWFLPEGSDGPPSVASGRAVLSQHELLQRLLPTDEVKERLMLAGFSDPLQEMLNLQPDPQRWQDFEDALKHFLGVVTGATNAAMMRHREDPTVGAERRRRHEDHLKRIAPSKTREEIEELEQQPSGPFTDAELDEQFGPGTAERVRQPMVTPNTELARELGKTVRARAKKTATGQKAPTKQPPRRRATRKEGT